MTAVEWLQDKWGNCKEWKWEEIQQWFEQAKKMEKQQMQDFGARCCLLTKQKNEWTLEELYKDLYGSKGNDGNFKQFSLYEHKETITSADIITSSQTEISDEEIWKEADKESFNTQHYAFMRGAKWYREQLKSR